MNLKGFKLVIAVTGGGSLFISDRLTEGGASEYLLEASVPYDQKALEKYVGGKVREKFCSGSTARQMALASYQRGLDLGEKKTIGVGVTCSLAKPGGEREGRVHAFYVALIHKQYAVVVKWTDNGKKNVFDTRELQEKFSAAVIKKSLEIFLDSVERMGHKETMILADTFQGLEMEYLGVSVEHSTPFGEQVFHGCSLGGLHTDYWGLSCYGNFKEAQAGEDAICIYPGSFNPFHEGHQEIYDYCVSQFGEKRTFLEISASNFDKPGLDSIEIYNRAASLKANTLFTNTATFIKKYLNLKSKPPIVFAVGADTFDRIDLDDFDGVIPGNVRFLVFPRNGKSIHDYFVPSYMVDQRSYALTRQVDISSTDLRKKALV